MASCSCGTRDKPKPVSPLSRGLSWLGRCMRLAFRNGADIFRCKSLLVLVGLGRLSFEDRFWDMPEKLPLSSRVGREVVLPCGFESLRLLTRKASRSAMRSRGWFLWLGRRDLNARHQKPELPLNYVRCAVLPKSNSSSLPNLRGHRKRHRAGVRRVSAHHLR